MISPIIEVLLFITKTTYVLASGGDKCMLKRHEKSESHQACLARADRFIEICDGDAQSVEEFISTAYANRI